DGQRRQVESSISLIRNAKGETIGFMGIIRDVTEKKKAEETIRHMAYHDFLTGLPNRLLFTDRLNVAMAQARRQQVKIALMMLDLDKFKEINDTLGHNAGDILLQKVGKRLAELVREGDTAARVGGDEFTLLMHNITDNKDVAVIATKVLEVFQNPFICDQHKLYITPSIGIAIYPNHGLDTSSVLNHADQAMYRAKEKGNGYYIYGQ
ncbi:MAG: sensor domain-containing diguanylate cyclase, partial [Syntrophales bacterium]|nr:sensor domain-containing diguanylate cyclase [Syntrophales bacterium]